MTPCPSEGSYRITEPEKRSAPQTTSREADFKSRGEYTRTPTVSECAQISTAASPTSTAVGSSSVSCVQPAVNARPVTVIAQRTISRNCLRMDP